MKLFIWSLCCLMVFLLEVDVVVHLKFMLFNVVFTWSWSPNSLEIDVSLHSSRPDVHAYTWRTWSSCSFEVDPPGDLHDVVVWERTAGIEVVTALSSDPPDELTHVRRVAVLRRGGHTHRPDEVDEVCLGGESCSLEVSANSWHTNFGRQWTVIVLRTSSPSAGTPSCLLFGSLSVVSVGPHQPVICPMICTPVSVSRKTRQNTATTRPPSSILATEFSRSMKRSSSTSSAVCARFSR